jgi:hypothetical protein
MLLQPVSKLWIVVSFKINQAEIAQTLCENRAKPQLSCNGKCVLVKELKKTEQNQAKDLPPTLKEKSEILYCQAILPTAIQQALYKLKPSILNGFYLGRPTDRIITDIFHPPSC